MGEGVAGGQVCLPNHHSRGPSQQLFSLPARGLFVRERPQHLQVQGFLRVVALHGQVPQEEHEGGFLISQVDFEAPRDVTEELDCELGGA